MSSKKKSKSSDEQKQIDEYKTVFDMFDRDGSGTIDVEELNEIIKSIYGEGVKLKELQDMVDQFDANHNGEIDFDEFCGLMQNNPNHYKDDEQELREAFNVFDENGDGSITAKELTRIMQCVGEKISKDTIDMMIKSVDLDGDGEIGFDEFVKIMRDGPI
eukprot:TRINITY_DN65875_c12_g7_i1.p1 TRINITY_DN65875_c12_g7~~TRINITY_DN65875_c12_g7_i1.p1  ORF type:complete len:160 (-),score=100.63 TRINITY_DN65875_c12_g7_i1:728-1207(-)